MLGEDPSPACAAWERSVQVEAAGKLKELFPKIDDVEDGLAGYLGVPFTHTMDTDEGDWEAMDWGSRAMLL